MNAVIMFLKKRVVSLVLLVLLGVLIVLPLGFVALSAFLEEAPRPGNIRLEGFTLTNFELLTSSAARTGVLNSLIIGFGSGATAVLIGGFLAFLAARSNIRFRKAIYLLGVLPLMLPSYVGALAWGILGNKNAGLLNTALTELGLGNPIDVYGLAGVVFVLGIFNAPYAFTFVYGALSLMNPELEDAVTIHGGKPRHVLSNVTVPLVVPALLSSFILVFVLSFENFPVVQMLGSPAGVETLPTMIFRLMHATPTRGNEAASIAVVLTVMLLFATALQQRVSKRRGFATVTGKGFRPRTFSLGLWGIPAWIGVAGYALVVLVLPLLTLLYMSLRTNPYISSLDNLLDPSKLSAANYIELFSNPQIMTAMQNSVVVSLAAAAIGLVIAFAVSYVIYRTKLKWSAPLEYVAMSPLAVPSIVMGMGLLWTWLIMPLPVYGTLAVMVIAFVAAQMPQGLRGVSASITQVHPELEESVIVHGGNRFVALWGVTVPLMRTGLASTFVLLLMLSMRELTVPLFLFTTKTRLLSIAIFDFFEQGYTSRAAAVSIVYSVIIGLLAALSQLLAKSPARDSTRPKSKTREKENVP